MNQTSNSLRSVVDQSGLWNFGRENTHGFLLSPEVYEVNNLKNLEQLGSDLFECLAGLGRIATIACNEQLGRGSVWGMIASLFRSNVPSSHRQTQIIKPNSMPVICKVDLMEDVSGNLFIAEIDGHNRHGFGYATLAANMRHVLMPEANAFPGVAKVISDYTKKRGYDILALICPRQDRFYLPEYQILKTELKSLGIELEIFDDYNFKFDSKKRLLVDLPIGLMTSLSKQLVKAYIDGEVEFLIPPKPFLSSKFILALLRNDNQNSQLESILRSHISGPALDKIRKFIPPTYLVGNNINDDIKGNGDKKYVLKDFLSSGTKGVYFPDKPDFQKTFERATRSKKCSFILQEFVENRQRKYTYFPSGNGQHLEDDNWYNRIVAHFSRQGIAEVTITSTRGNLVHGGKNCLQLGSVITD